MCALCNFFYINYRVITGKNGGVDCGIISHVAELMFLETSALSGENVEETFLKCARSILTKIESGMINFSLELKTFCLILCFLHI